MAQLARSIFVHRKLLRRERAALWYSHKVFLHYKPQRGGRLLDIGCGEGAFLYYASPWYDVTGIDIDRDAISAARDLYSIQKAHPMSLEKFVEQSPT